MMNQGFPAPRFRPGSSGFTFIEVIVYVLVFSLFLGVLFSLFSWYRNAQTGTERLDVMHQLRLALFSLSDDLSYGSGILYPPETDANGAPAHQLVFKNATNEVIVVFVDPDHQLMTANLSRKARGESFLHRLGSHVTDFEVKRPGAWYVEYSITGREPQSSGPQSPDFHLLESTRIRNVLK